MIRQTLIAAAALTMAAAPALAQNAKAPADPEPGSEAWLRARGEAYRRAADADQDPVELEATARLNAEVASRNTAAEQSEARATAAYEQQNAEWRAETARLETERAQWEANAAAAEAARIQWERERAAWEANLEAGGRAGRGCIVAPPTRP